MYGKSLQRNLLNQSFSGSQIIENPELLQTMEEENVREEDKEEMEVEDVPIVVPSPIQQESPKTSSVLVPANKQTETRLPSGKRRITPMFLKLVPSSSTK